VDYDDDLPEQSGFRAAVASLLGRDYAYNVIGVQCPAAWLADRDVEVFSTFPHLQYFNVEGESITDSCLPTIGSVKSLESVAFFGCNITDDGLRQLASLGNLCAVFLYSTRVHGLGVGHLHRCRKLRELTLGGSILIPEAYPRIAALAELEELDLDCTGTTDDKVCALTQLRHLRRLYLDGNPITDRCLQYVASFPQLTVFCARGTQVSDAAAEKLRRARPQLEVFVQ
jgi:Leucine-rich repeat (LRR) protein